MRVARLGIVAALMTVLSGCAGPSPSGAGDDFPVVFSVSEALTVAQAHDLDWEVGVLQDGTITAGEYEDAYDRYIRCLYDLGFVEGVPKYLDPISSTQWRSLEKYEGPVEPDEMGEIMQQTCVAPLDLIGAPYMATTPQRMEARLLARFKACLDTEGIAYEGGEVNYNEFTADLGDAAFFSGPHMDCLTESMTDVHPGAIGVGVGR